jgi:hypothetical protein
LARHAQAALTAAVPFVVIAGAFAAVLAHHLGEPERAAARFAAAQALQAPLAGAVADDDRVTLLRMRCGGGACPAYRVSIDGAGRVEFAGQSGVCVTKPQSAVVDRAQAQRLILGLRDAGFGAIPRVIGAPSDRAGKFVELRVGAQAHRVMDHGAAPGDAPLVEAAAAAIDRVAGTDRWLPRSRIDGPPWCPLPDGRRGVFTGGGMRLVPEDADAGAPAQPASGPAR